MYTHRYDVNWAAAPAGSTGPNPVGNLQYRIVGPGVFAPLIVPSAAGITRSAIVPNLWTFYLDLVIQDDWLPGWELVWDDGVAEGRESLAVAVSANRIGLMQAQVAPMAAQIAALDAKIVSGERFEVTEATV